MGEEHWIGIQVAGLKASFGEIYRLSLNHYDR